MSQKGKFIEAESRLVVAWGWRQEQRLTANRQEGCYEGWGDDMSPDLEMWLVAPKSLPTMGCQIVLSISHNKTQWLL